MKKKFIGIFLAISLLAQFSITALAGKKLDPNKKSIDFSYTFKNIENATHQKNINSYVNFCTVMQKLLNKYNIQKKYSKQFFKTPEYYEYSLKTFKKYRIGVEINKTEDDVFKKLFKNYENDVKNIKITEKDFEEAKKNLININNDYLYYYKRDIKNMEKKYDYDNLQDKANSIKIGKIIKNEHLESFKKNKEKAIKNNNKKELIKINKQIKNVKQDLKNTKELKDLGNMICNNYRLQKNNIAELESHIKQIKNVKFNDIKDLTKNIDKMELNKEINY